MAKALIESNVTLPAVIHLEISDSKQCHVFVTSKEKNTDYVKNKHHKF